MAQIDGECSVLLNGGANCRRAARFTCSDWHLVCSTHHHSNVGSDGFGCPLCGTELMAFSHIEMMYPGGRRVSDGLVNSMGSLFSRARESLMYRLRDEPEMEDGGDLENEI